jgi:hypothetical protein
LVAAMFANVSASTACALSSPARTLSAISTTVRIFIGVS